MSTASPQPSDTISPAGECGESKEFDLGILFVHGIGDQRRGGTLVAFVDPLYRCLHRWLTEDDRLEREHEQARKLRSQRADKVRKQLARQEQEARRLHGRQGATAGGWLGRMRQGWDRARARRRMAYAFATGPLPEPIEPPVTISDTALRSGGETGTEPAHLTMCVADPGAPPQAGAERSTWCLAESWWAQELDTPSFKAIARWAFLIAPALMTRQLAKGFRRRMQGRRDFGGRRWGVRWAATAYRRVTGVLLVGMGMSMAVVIQVVLLVLVVLGAIPIPKVSGYVARLGGRIAALIGDSYVLVESPTQLDAMVNRVRADLQWLAARCEKVAVVGHSQGAVIAHYCLQRYHPVNAERFLTVGSGLGKLNQIARLRRKPDGSMEDLVGLAFFVLVVAWGAMVVLGIISDGFTWGLGIVLVLWFVGAVFMVVVLWASMFRDVMMSEVEEEHRNRKNLDLHEAAGRGLRWLDFYASADPVPAGPIFEEPPSWLSSCQVWNRCSVFTDHSRYRDNFDGFLPRFALEISRLLPQDSLLRAALEEDRGRIAVAARRRAWRLGWLVGARWVVLGAATFAGWRRRHALPDLGRNVSEKTPDWVHNVVGELAQTAQTVYDPFHGQAHTVVGVLVAIAAGLLAYGFVYWLWSRWERRDVNNFFRREPADLGGAAAGSFVAAVVVVMAGGAAGGIARLLLWFHSVALLSVGLVVVGGCFVAVSLWQLAEEEAPEARPNKPTNIGVRFLQLVAVAVPLTVTFAALAPGLWVDSPYPRVLLVPACIILLAPVIRKAIERRGSRIGDWMVRQSTAAEPLDDPWSPSLGERPPRAPRVSSGDQRIGWPR